MGEDGFDTDARGSAYDDSQINDIVKALEGDGFKNNPLRQSYETEVSDLVDLGNDLLSQGLSTEDIAMQLHEARRNLGIQY